MNSLRDFPDKPGSNAHIIRQRVRSVLSDKWQGIDDIRIAVKKNFEDYDILTKFEINRALTVLKKWEVVESGFGHAESRTTMNSDGHPRMVKGWRLRHAVIQD